jgi:hypothetical protein
MTAECDVELTEELPKIGPGNDRIFGGPGLDTMFGGPSVDRIDGVVRDFAQR